MKIRKMLKYPPYYYICYIKISGRDADYIFRQAVKIKNSFDRNLNYTTILGPSPCNIFKVNNIHTKKPSTIFTDNTRQIYKYEII